MTPRTVIFVMLILCQAFAVPDMVRRSTAFGAYRTDEAGGSAVRAATGPRTIPSKIPLKDLQAEEVKMQPLPEGQRASSPSKPQQKAQRDEFSGPPLPVSPISCEP